jgi:hypothetical protein
MTIVKSAAAGIGLSLAAGVLAIAPLAATSAPAQAKICKVDHVFYKAPAKGSGVWIPTSLFATWQKGGGEQSRTSEQGADSSKTTGSSDSVGGEAGASFGFGSASASYNHTWDRSTTYSTSYSSSWSYTLNLPKAKSRSRLYKKGFEFPIVQHTVYTNGCDTRVTKWSVVAPVEKNGSGTYLWAVETYKHRGELKR